MKLTEDQKATEENVINREHFDAVERNGLERAKTIGLEERPTNMLGGEEKEDRRRIANDDQTQTKNGCPVVTMNEKKPKEGMKSENTENNVNINKEERKLVRQLTQEMASLRLKSEKTANAGRKETDTNTDKPSCPKSEGKGGSFDGVTKKDVSCDIPVADITACMELISLETKMKEISKQSDKDIILIADKIDTAAATVQVVKERPVKDEQEQATVVIVSLPEKKGEENEDFAATRLLSDAECMSFIARGPIEGIPKGKGNRESRGCAQPRKYSRPSAEPMSYNQQHMCGGFVQVVQESIQPTSLYDLKHLENLNVPSTAFQYAHSDQRGFMPLMSEIDLMPNNFDPSFNPINWPVVMQPPTFCGTDLHLPPDIGGEFGEFSLPQYIMSQGMDGYPPFAEAPSPNATYMNSQISTGSPYDQVLSSPGSSPPSYANSPYSNGSVFTTDCDAPAMSPSGYSMSSPESGIFTDLTEEATLDLELAMEFLREQAFNGTGIYPERAPIPQLIEALNTGHDPIGGTVLPSSIGSHPVVTGTDHRVKRPRKPPQQRRESSKQQPRILPPVAGDNIPPVSTFQTPYVLIESPAKRNVQPVRIQPRIIQPKVSIENPNPAIQQASQSAVQQNAVPTFTPPANTPSQEPLVTSSSEQDQLVKAYRWVAGLPKDRLVVQDDDGDTILHLTIVKEEMKLVRALLERYTREELLDTVINLANKQHQTPLCLAVFLNQTDIVEMLIQRNADVNVQLQRKLNGGLMCYRLIHYAAKRGQKWVPTLVQLLSAENIDLHAFDSEGCTAMHCAIRDHGETRIGAEKINSKDTIYHLAKHGADLNSQHGLSGKTPLHYAIEKKDSDLVGWFLGLALHLQSSGAKPPGNGSPSPTLMQSILSAKQGSGITALQLALNIQMDQEERVRILEMLLKHGAEVSQRSCDGKLRQELAKYPKLAPLLKNGINALKNVR